MNIALGFILGVCVSAAVYFGEWREQAQDYGQYVIIKACEDAGEYSTGTLHINCEVES